MLSLPFVIPPALTTPVGFGPEWLSMATGMAAVLAALRANVIRGMPAAAAWLLLLIPVFALQTLTGNPPYLQYALLATAYVLHAVLMLQLGQGLADQPQPDRGIKMLATALVAVALANAVTGLLQAAVPGAWTAGWLPALAGARAYGLIQYINPYAGFLLIGAVALAWLHACDRVSMPWATGGALLLGSGAALSGSRSVLLYLGWMAAMGFAMLPRARQHPGRAAFARALFLSAGCIAVAQLMPPALAWLPGPAPTAGTLARIGQAALGSEPRLALWQLAWDMFITAPLSGVGIGRFAETAFHMGLPAGLRGSIWTSSHNLLLDMLAETGLAGTVPLLAGLALVILATVRRLQVDDGPAWFAATAAGIALLHAMLEYPLRFAHFLGLTALLLGLCSGSMPVARARRVPSRAPTLLLCLLLGPALLIALRDWQGLDRVRLQGSWRESTPRSDAAAETGRAELQALTRGPFGAEAERWMLLGTPLTAEHLPQRLALADRVARYWPGSDTLARQSIYLALAGQREAAASVLRGTLAAFPGRIALVRSLLEQAAANNPAAIQPLIDILAPGQAGTTAMGPSPIPVTNAP